MSGKQRLRCWRDLHDLTVPENVLYKSNGHRQCRPCHDRAQRDWYARTRSGVGPARIDSDACEVEGCDQPRKVSGEKSRSRYCATHLTRFRRHGDLFEEIPIGPRRFRSLVKTREWLRAAQGQDS